MSRQKIKQPRYVFWTSGWDSTYMVIKLLRDGYTVQPIYIINPKRKSRHHELLALQSLSRLISQRIKTGELLPYQTFDLRTVKTDPAITQAFTNIMDQLPEGQRPLGYQYCYLANFAKQHPEFPVIGIGLERALSPDQCACSAIIRQFGQLTPDHRIAESSSPDLITLLGTFDFPVIDTTEVEMAKNIKSWGYEDIMQHIWFCHKPIKGVQCGFCNPCSSKIIGQMDFLLPPSALSRYHKIQHFEQRHGKIAKKLLGLFYRFRGHWILT